MDEEHWHQALRNVLLIILWFTLLFTCGVSSALYPEMVLFFPLRGSSYVSGYRYFAWGQIIHLLGCISGLFVLSFIEPLLVHVCQPPCGRAR